MAITAALAATIAGKIVAAVAGQTAKVFINKLLKLGDECRELREKLHAQVLELERVANSTQESLVSRVSVPFDWLDDVQLCLYELEDMEDSEIPTWNKYAAEKILQTNLTKVEATLEKLRRIRRTEGSERQPSEVSMVMVPNVTSIRRDDKKRIIQELNSDEKANPYGVSIVGIAGAGKTVLARDVARDTSINDHFRVIDPPSSANLKLEEVIKVVRNVAKEVQPNKKFLILLDGLDSVKPYAWGNFRLECENILAKIKFLITTQNPQVADTTGTSKHCLDPLSKADCFTLIREHAHTNRNFTSAEKAAIECNEQVLVDKSMGLPLLAQRIGLHLSAAPQNQRIEKIRLLASEPVIPALKEALVDLKPVSLLGEKPHLIRCLAYCSLFPQDYEFREDNLVHLWIAEGFTLNSGDSWRVEESARCYFDELLRSCSLFQPSAMPPDDAPNCYKMHKLAYDMAHYVASNIFCREDLGMSNSSSKISKITHHFSLINIGEHDDIQNLLSSIETTCLSLRTFLMFNEAGKKINKNPTFFKSLTRLRVLDLSHTNLEKLHSRHIRKLKYLRYLDLSYTPVDTLPNLSNSPELQVLKLHYCDNLLHLPKDLKELTSLVSLEVNKRGLASMPSGIGKLTNLKWLDVFVVGKKEGFKIAELKNLNHLRKSLRITQLENVETEKDAQEANLSKKGRLQRLELEWSSSATDEIEAAKQVLERLQPPKNLEELVIRNYPSAEFPTWLSKPYLGILKSLHLHNCKAIPSLNPFKELKNLLVGSMNGEVILDEEQRECVRARGINFEIDSVPQNVSDLPLLTTGGDPSNSVQEDETTHETQLDSYIATGSVQQNVSDPPRLTTGGDPSSSVLDNGTTIVNQKNSDVATNSVLQNNTLQFQRTENGNQQASTTASRSTTLKEDRTTASRRPWLSSFMGCFTCGKVSHPHSKFGSKQV